MPRPLRPFSGHPRRSVLPLLALLAVGTPWARAHEGDHGLITRLEEHLRGQPDDAGAHLARAEAAGRQGDWAAALRHLDEADRIAPGTSATAVPRAETWLVAGNAVRAAGLLDEHLAGHPADARAWLARGRAAVRLRDADTVRAAFTAALRHTAAPQPDLRLEAADAFAALGHTNEAVRVLAEGLSTGAPAPALVIRAAELDLARGEADAAIARMDAMAAASVRPEPWLARRASLLARANRTDEARSAWQDLAGRLAALPPEQRASHAMARLLETTRFALAALDSGPQKAALP